MDKPIKTYIVIWNGHEFILKDYEKALEKAKDLTYGEDVYNSALIISRCEWLGDFPEVKISNLQCLTWIINGMYELI